MSLKTLKSLEKSHIISYIIKWTFLFILFGVLQFWEHRYCVSWRFFIFKINWGLFSTARSGKWSVHISKVYFIWESVDWARKKCLFPTLRVAEISGLNLEKMHVRVFFPHRQKKTVRNKEMSVLGGCRYSGVRLYIVTSFHPVWTHIETWA